MSNRGHRAELADLLDQREELELRLQMLGDDPGLTESQKRFLTHAYNQSLAAIEEEEHTHLVAVFKVLGVVAVVAVLGVMVWGPLPILVVVATGWLGRWVWKSVRRRGVDLGQQTENQSVP